MPISVNADLVRLSQREFGEIAYRVMGEAFGIHRDLGTLFDEKVYKNALAMRVTDLRTEVRIDISSFDQIPETYPENLGRFFNATALDAIPWINISRSQLSFATVR